MRVLDGLFIPLVLLGLRLHAQGCAPTPEAAVQGAIGSVAQLAGSTSGTGYRVQDVQVDTVLHRVWVRVSHCGDTGQPLVMVPLRAALAWGPQPGGQAPYASAPGLPAEQHFSPAPVQMAAVHPGDAVKVFFASESVRMEIEGTADTQAALGEGMSVTLKRRGDEPPHRIRGVLRADHRVEVEP